MLSEVVKVWKTGLEFGLWMTGWEVVEHNELWKLSWKGKNCFKLIQQLINSKCYFYESAKLANYVNNIFAFKYVKCPVGGSSEMLKSWIFWNLSNVMKWKNEFDW